MAESGSTGELRRFLLEGHPVRGQWVQLREAWQELRSVQPYPAVVEALLGDAATAAVLLASTLKFSGKLTLQMSGDGLVSLLVAQCTDDFRIRAIAHHRDEIPAASTFPQLVGNGRLVVTVESTEQSARYQGIVPLSGTDMAGCLEAYFASSEQLPTRLMLASDDQGASGLLIQKLPEATRGEASGAALQSVWEDLELNLQRLSPLRLQQDTAPALLQTLCGDHDCRLFGSTRVRFECSCSAQRVGELLRSIGEAEARSVLAEQGAVTITCEFCRRAWRFDAVDVERLFLGNVTPTPGQRLN